MTPLFDRNVPGSTEALARACVAIAGCGGIGSNAALALTRAGIGRLILVDRDAVEESNLNRQQFFAEDIGRRKVGALRHRLLSVNPGLGITTHDVELTPVLVPQLFEGADLLIEAFDQAESKQWLIEAWCRAFPDRPVVVGSGLSGLGKTEALRVRRSGRIIVCGDESSDLREGLCAPRLAIVANMQANEAVAWLVGRSGPAGQTGPSPGKGIDAAGQ